MTAPTSPRNILITGATGGLGAALAHHYAAPGIMLALTGRDEARLEAVAQVCRAAGAHVETAVIDVTARAALADWIIRIDEIYTLDLVVANAGISGGTGGGQDTSEPADQARRIFEVNLTGVLNTIDPVLPRMVARGRGQIALMSSLSAFSGWPSAPAYSTSKGAVRLYGEALRGAYAARGVRINVLCPGFVRTPMTDVNPFPMPFLMDADRAARLMAKGLARNRGRIAFPWPVYGVVRLLSMLPSGLTCRLLRFFPEKPAL